MLTSLLRDGRSHAGRFRRAERDSSADCKILITMLNLLWVQLDGQTAAYNVALGAVFRGVLTRCRQQAPALMARNNGIVVRRVGGWEVQSYIVSIRCTKKTLGVVV